MVLRLANPLSLTVYGEGRVVLSYEEHGEPFKNDQARLGAFETAMALLCIEFQDATGIDPLKSGHLALHAN